MADHLGEGIHDISAERYHADDLCAMPTLSSSIAAILLSQSPRHAWTAHPRLNPAFEPENKKAFDIGHAVHTLVLGDGRKIQVINADDYRKKDAQAARDAAYVEGRIPVLAADMVHVNAMYAAVRAQLAAHQDASDAFTDGKPERTLIWQERGVWVRARADWMPNNPARPWDDMKTSSTSANPESWVRKIYDLGADIQCALYRRGIRALFGVENPSFRFVVAETEPPYALSVIGLTPAAIDLADRKMDEALDIWAWCLKNDKWPGYPARTAYVDPPVYAERQWLEREERKALHAKPGKKEIETWLAWQAPADL